MAPPPSPGPAKPRTARPRRDATERSPKIAVLSDIHSNLQALDAVLAECARRGVDRFFCLGDIVGYGADPAACLKKIRALRCPTVLGNHDCYVADGEAGEYVSAFAVAGVEHSVRQLTKSARQWLAGLSEVFVAGPITLVHASLVEPLDWEYITSAALAGPTLRRQTTPLCFCGHTHRPQLFATDGALRLEGAEEGKVQCRRDGRSLINPGSVGQPRGGDPRAQFAIVDPGDLTVEMVRVPYDIEAAAQAILAAGLPPFLGERLFEGV